jgi:hypothetical protein
MTLLKFKEEIMKFDFKVYELLESSMLYKSLIEENKNPNEFIIVGETEYYYKVHQWTERGLCLIPGISISDFALHIPKEDIQIKSIGYGTELMEIDIPKQYLNMHIIENIQALND